MGLRTNKIKKKKNFEYYLFIYCTLIFFANYKILGW